MRDHDGGGPHFALDLPQFKLHFFTQFGVQVGQRLVQQQHWRLNHQSASQSHPLALSAREFPGVALRQIAQVHQSQSRGHALGTFGLGHGAHLQAKTHILGHRHVGKQRIALKHNAQAARVRGFVGDVLAIQKNVTFAGFYKAGHHLQRGGFAAARRPQQGDELAFFNAQVHLVDGALRAVKLGKICQRQKRHSPHSCARWPGFGLCKYGRRTLTNGV